MSHTKVDIKDLVDAFCAQKNESLTEIKATHTEAVDALLAEFSKKADIMTAVAEDLQKLFEFGPAGRKSIRAMQLTKYYHELGKEIPNYAYVKIHLYETFSPMPDGSPRESAPHARASSITVEFYKEKDTIPSLDRFMISTLAQGFDHFKTNGPLTRQELLVVFSRYVGQAKAYGYYHRPSEEECK